MSALLFRSVFVFFLRYIFLSFLFLLGGGGEGAGRSVEWGRRISVAFAFRRAYSSISIFANGILDSPTLARVGVEAEVERGSGEE